MSQALLFKSPTPTKYIPPHNPLASQDQPIVLYTILRRLSLGSRVRHAKKHTTSVLRTETSCAGEMAQNEPHRIRGRNQRGKDIGSACKSSEA